MASTVYLVGPWAGDRPALAALRAAIGRIGGEVCEVEGATSAVRVRRIAAERWVECGAELARALAAAGSVCAFELSVDTRANRAVLHRLRPDPRGGNLARCTGEGLPLPDRFDAEDLTEVACDLALCRLAGDGGTVSPGSVGATAVFYRSAPPPS